MIQRYSGNTYRKCSSSTYLGKVSSLHTSHRTFPNWVLLLWARIWGSCRISSCGAGVSSIHLYQSLSLFKPGSDTIYSRPTTIAQFIKVALIQMHYFIHAYFFVSLQGVMDLKNSAFSFLFTSVSFVSIYNEWEICVNIYGITIFARPQFSLLFLLHLFFFLYILWIKSIPSVSEDFLSKKPTEVLVHHKNNWSLMGSVSSFLWL